ncbi:hypothetical protein [Plantactinospora sp. KBS50]|uniref:hypothetical protein n=1 Tax=Plantactinospora sp. KBS50 TaxID=2024580 RepID=UPI000BAB0DED|nr:hypothetical protein [Plantactinospora sp. KBS50]ASW55376.1 hypothetical protein CIK06_16190 [Plantactinospora sp. KBS50]
MIGRTLRAGLALVLAGAGALVGSTPAGAAGTAGYCPDAAGVTVVVDFNELGGGTVVRCAPGDQATGLAALKSAGFQVTGTLRWGEGFICRIDGRPTAATEKCVDTPPASAYWSYWYAANGGSWTYSDKGVLNRKPPAGSFEGWSFSLNRSADNAPRPGAAPTRPAAPAPTSAAPPPAPTRPPASGNGPAPTSAAGGGTGTSAAPGGAAGPAAPGAAPDPAAPGGATGTASPAGPGTPPAEPAPGDAGAAPDGGTPPDGDPSAVTDVAARRPGGGPPLGTLVGILLLVALAAGGLVAARRRRAAAPDD